MAAEPEGRHFLLGECKYRNTPVSTSDFDRLRAKFTPPAGSEVCYYLFSKSGFTPALKKAAAKENLTLVGLAEVVCR